MEHLLTPGTQSKLLRAAALAPFVLAACGSEMIGEPLGQEGAHEHGVAVVGLVVEGQAATVAFRAPAADLWGFERPPESQDEIDARARALAALKAGIVEALGFDARLACRIISTRWDGAAVVEGERDDAGDQHDAHDHHHTDDHHDPDDHNDEDEHHDHESSDVIAEFDIQCSEPLAGSRLTLAVADLFEAIEKVDLQAVSEARQFGRRVPARGSSIEL